MSDAWRLVYEGFDPTQEPLREALCTLGNGRFATRGATEESRADEVHYPGTYIAGGYNRLASVVAGRDVVNEDLVNFQNWLPLSFRPAGGAWLGEDGATLNDYRQELDLRSGVLHRAFTVRDAEGRKTRVATRRIVHMGDPHFAGISQAIVPLNWSGVIEIRSGLDGGVTNRGVARYRGLRGDHIETIDAGGTDDGPVFLHARTKQSRLEASFAARTKVWLRDEPLTSVGEVDWSDDAIRRTFGFDVQPGYEIRVEKIVALRTSRDLALGDLVGDALLAARRAPDFDELLASHRVAWDALWERYDVEVTVSPEIDLAPHSIQLILRLHTFHLLQTASPHSVGLDVSVPARGLHGEAYRGHIFWDEMYLFPFYLYRDPDLARALLLYRYHRLGEARANAIDDGRAGAMFPWQSGSSGREETQIIHLNPRSGAWDPDHSHLQRHVNAAIAYNVWTYCRTTDDGGFLRSYGAELLLEIARFWVSLSRWNEARNRYEIVGVMGPDEFHEGYPDGKDGGLRNNTYTNVMAVWCLQRALAAMALLDEPASHGLRERLGLDEDEVRRWEDITQRMYLPIDSDGLLEQFEGYSRLEELDWDAYRAEYAQIGRMDRILRAEGDSPDRYKASKQADLCMLFYLLDRDELVTLLHRLGYELTGERLRETIRFYRDRTSHGSTLSHLVFAAILDEIDRDAAWEHFVEALRSDVEDVQEGTTPEGIHTAVMAGTVRHVIERFAGVRLTDEAVSICPRLPDGISRIRCSVLFRETPVSIEVDRSSVEFDVPAGETSGVAMVVGSERLVVGPGDRIRTRYGSAGT